jgi:FixJ family two-component response regulator
LQACYAAGADDFLDKPFETEALLASLRRMSSHRTMDFA